MSKSLKGTKYIVMTLRRPLPEELEAAAKAQNLRLSQHELEVFRSAIDETLRSHDRLEQLVEPRLEVKYPRLPGYRPPAEENLLGAWATKCSVKGADYGPLHGKTIAVKDVVSVAGIPLLNGSSMMEGYIPDVDATVVTRVLDAGGEIVGKAACEAFSFSGGSHTSYPTPVLNPYDRSRMAGGSSSGSAVLLATGECDLAIGADQGGSIREPSAYCGIYGLKPTFGLVPFTGVGSTEPSIDHVGPMARTISDLALLLDVIAGRDELDPRQAATPTGLPSYSQDLERGCEGVRIGIVTEGFGWPKASEDDVDEGVRAAALRFRELGAKVTDISIPWHRDGLHIFSGVVLEGAWSTMVRDDGVGRGSTGYYNTHLLDFYARAHRARAHDFPPNLKLVILAASYLAERYQSHYYAKAQNLRRVLGSAYDCALNEVDLLAMPTVPQKAISFDCVRELQDDLFVSLNMIQNTCPFNLTGHPAISVPCGLVEGLPIGIMLAGPRWEDAAVLQAARAFETLGLSTTPTPLNATQ